MMQQLNWSCVGFDDLLTSQLYDILKLRSEVFVIEQNCAYQDMDDFDQDALHVLGSSGEVLLCYARLLSPDVKYKEPSIGRVITAQSIRQQGFGKQVLNHSLSYCSSRWPNQAVRISAQQHLH